jgi:hypothetical protein
VEQEKPLCPSEASFRAIYICLVIMKRSMSFVALAYILDLMLAILNMNMFPSTERVIALLQCAEDVSKGSDWQRATQKAQQFFNHFDLEPRPIGPQGIEQVVDQVPPLQWNHAFELPSLASSLDGASFSFSNNLSSNDLIHLTPNREEQQQQNKVDSSPLMTVQQKCGMFPNPISSKIAQDKISLPASEVASVVSTDSTSNECGAQANLDKRRYRSYQKGQWNERFEDLMAFRAEHGHLFVPHLYPTNQKLSQWVKR